MAEDLCDNLLSSDPVFFSFLIFNEELCDRFLKIRDGDRQAFKEIESIRNIFPRAVQELTDIQTNLVQKRDQFEDEKLRWERWTKLRMKDVQRKWNDIEGTDGIIMKKENNLLTEKISKLTRQLAEAQQELAIYKEKEQFDLYSEEEQAKIKDVTKYSKSEIAKITADAKKANQYSILRMEVAKQTKILQTEREKLREDEEQFHKLYEEFLQKKQILKEEETKLRQSQENLKKEFSRLYVEQQHHGFNVSAFQAQRKGWLRDKDNYEVQTLLLNQQKAKIERLDQLVQYNQERIDYRDKALTKLIERVKKIPRFIADQTTARKVSEYILDALTQMREDTNFEEQDVSGREQKDLEKHEENIRMIALKSQVASPDDWEAKYTLLIAEYDQLKRDFNKSAQDFSIFREILTKSLAGFHHNEEVLVDNVERCLRGFENSELVVLAQQNVNISHIARLELSTSQVQKVMHLVPDKLQELQIEVQDVSPGAPGAGLLEGIKMSAAVNHTFSRLLSKIGQLILQNNLLSSQAKNPIEAQAISKKNSLLEKRILALVKEVEGLQKRVFDGNLAKQLLETEIDEQRERHVLLRKELEKVYEIFLALQTKVEKYEQVERTTVRIAKGI